MTNRDFHDCTHHCNPDTCKVQAQERFADGQDVMDDGLPAKCCGRCRNFDYYGHDHSKGGCMLDETVTKEYDATDYCLAFELREF